MKLFVLVVLVLGSSCCEETHKRVEERCRKDCVEYGAVFARVHSGKDCNRADSYECWCRRGAEQGSGSDPLRIW